jgi:hypothetical protein
MDVLAFADVIFGGMENSRGDGGYGDIRESPKERQTET